MFFKNAAIVSLVLGSALSACGKKSNKDDAPKAPAPTGKTEESVKQSGLFGKWGTISIPMTNEESGIEMGKLKLDFTFAEGKVTASFTCSFNNGKSIGPVEVASAANISSDTIDVLENKENSVKGEGDSNCNGSIDKGKMNYVVKGDALTLKPSDGSSPMDLKRL